MIRYCILDLQTGKPASGLTNNLRSLKIRMNQIENGGLYTGRYGIFSYRRKCGEHMGAKLDLTIRKPYRSRTNG